MRKKDFNFDGIQIKEGSNMFTNSEEVKTFYDHIESQTKNKFKHFEKANRESEKLARERII